MHNLFGPLPGCHSAQLSMGPCQMLMLRQMQEQIQGMLACSQFPSQVYNSPPCAPAPFPDGSGSPLHQLHQIRAWSRGQGGVSGIGPSTTPEQDQAVNGMCDKLIHQQMQKIQAEVRKCTPAQYEVLLGVNKQVHARLGEGPPVAREGGGGWGHHARSGRLTFTEALLVRCQITEKECAQGRLPASLRQANRDFAELLHNSQQRRTDTLLKYDHPLPPGLESYARVSPFRTYG